MKEIFCNYYTGNGRIVVEAERLPSLACIDTALDLEIEGLTQHLQSLLVLQDFYASNKCVVLHTVEGIVQTTLEQLLAQISQAQNKDNPQISQAQNKDNPQISQAQNKNAPQILAVFIAADAGFCKQRYGFFDLIRIVRRLTAVDGCAWDRVQTHKSIANNMIEEAYEAASAALSGQILELREELGDVLLQPVFGCDIAERGHEFSLIDCITELCTKLYSRHTHVFGDRQAADAAGALDSWERAKASEKNYCDAAARIDKLPHILPALMRAQKTIKAIGKEWQLDEGRLLEQMELTLSEAKQGASAERLLILTAALLSIKKIDAETTLLHQTNELKTVFKNKAGGVGGKDVGGKDAGGKNSESGGKDAGGKNSDVGDFVAILGEL